MDANPELAAQFGIQSIPTLLIFREGALVRQFTGVTPPEELLAAIGGA